MNKRAWRIVLAIHVIMVVLIASTAFAAKPKHEKDQSFVPHWWERSQVVKKLDLSDDQLSKIRDIYKERSPGVNQAKDRLVRERISLRRFLSQDHPDEDKAREQIDTLGAALSGLVKSELEMNYEMMRELKRDQRRSLIEALEQHRPKAKSTKKEKDNLSEKKKLEKRYNRF